MKTSFLEPNEIADIPFKKVGVGAKISRNAMFYNPEKTEIGDFVRIDDFCLFSGEISIGSNVHISAFNALYGQFGISLGDFSGLSPRCILLSGSDDFSGNALVGPMVPDSYRNVQGGLICLERFVQVGTGSTIMPGTRIAEGAVVGAMSLVKEDLREWSVYCGIPAKYLKERSRELLNKWEGYIKKMDR